MTFIEAANFTKGRIRPIQLIIVHDMEAPEGPATAENVANFFHNQPRNGNGSSATVCVDENSIVDCVREADTPWAAPNANSNGLHIEHAGYARQSKADWLSASNIAMLEISAARAAHWAVKYGIPVRRLTVAELRAGAKGFAGHIDVTNALNGGVGHTDPGENFPWDHYLSRVNAHIGAQNPSSSSSGHRPAVKRHRKTIKTPAWFKRTLKDGDKGADVHNAQRAINRHHTRDGFKPLVADGHFGPATAYAVRRIQARGKLTVDGIIGPRTARRIGKA